MKAGASNLLINIITAAALASAYPVSFLRFRQSVDVHHRRWSLVISNPSPTRTVVTRMKGKVRIHNATEGPDFAEVQVPLGGFLLQPNEAVMTEVALPSTPDLLILTCHIDLPDLPGLQEDKTWVDSVTLGPGPEGRPRRFMSLH